LICKFDIYRLYFSSVKNQNKLINKSTEVYNLCKADNISDQGAKLDADVQHKLATLILLH